MVQFWSINIYKETYPEQKFQELLNLQTFRGIVGKQLTATFFFLISPVSPAILKHPETCERASPSSAKGVLARADAVLSLSPCVCPCGSVPVGASVPPPPCCMQPQGTVTVCLSPATCKTLDLELFLKDISAHQDHLNSFKTSILLFALKVDLLFIIIIFSTK